MIVVDRRGDLVKSLILQGMVGLRRRREKIEKYQDLRRGLQKIWNVRVNIIALVVGSFGAIPTQFRNRTKETGITSKIGQIQRTVLLGTSRKFRQVLKI